MKKTYDFTFFEGYWKFSFRLTTDDTGTFVESWEPNSVKVWNGEDPYEPSDEQDLEGVEWKLCYAFDNREVRKDPRDVLVEVRK